MLNKTILPLLLSFLPFFLQGQKQVYLPNEWLQGSLDYSFTRSAQSDNFIVFWGPLAGDDPTQAPGDIAFDPQTILNTAEQLYKFYIDTIQFIHDGTGLISQYKIILVMLNTWTGLEGWAFGGSYDATVGAMWMHPQAALSGPTLAHEFTHTLQNYTWMMNPGHGFIDSSYVGFFWETHAEFMALQRYPSVALEFDMARWLNTCQFHWSSTRHHYQAFVFLEFIKEKDGIQMINRLWNESIIGEHPLETYKRLKGINQEELNDLFAEYAMRNVTWDYEIGDLLRERVSTLESKFVSHPTIVVEAVDESLGRYTIPNHLAPQDYGYNIIRLFPDTLPGCQKRSVHLNFQNQYILPDYQDAGLRFGLVAVTASGTPRYSEIYNWNTEFAFDLQQDETEVYLVVSGAPKVHHNYAWEIGFPKIYRYPFDFILRNAKPEGFQKGYRTPPNVAGAPHLNGGGFVAATAHVDPSAYVSPLAQVLDQAQVLGNARIEGTSIIKHNAVVEDSATISGQAIVGEDAHVFDHAVITGQAHVFGGNEIYGHSLVDGNALLFFTQVYEDAHLTDNTFCWGANLHGDIYLGGDAEFFTECSDGTYLQFEGAYGRNCDGLDDHPANEEIIETFYSPALINDYTLLCEGLTENIFTYLSEWICNGDTLYYNGEAYTEDGNYTFEYEAASGVDSIVNLSVEMPSPVELNIIGEGCPGDTIWFMNFPIVQGIEYDTIIDDGMCGVHFQGSLNAIDIDTTLSVTGNTLGVQEPSFFIQWYDCETNLPIEGALGKFFTPSKSGYYKAKIISLDTCEVFTSCYYVLGVGFESSTADLNWKVSPNPVDEFLYLEFESPLTSRLILEIVDMLGKIQSKEIVPTGTSSFSLDVVNLLPGFYTVRAVDQGQHIDLRRFVKI